MRRSTVIFAGLLLAAGFTVANACGSDSPLPASREISADDGGEVSLSDGSLTLVVPPGALPHNTVISVERVETNSDRPDDDVTELATYAFGPAGTVFLQPVALSFKLPATLLRPGFLIEHSPADSAQGLVDGETEVLGISNVTFSEDGSEVTVETEIAHFSIVKFLRQQKFFEAELDLPQIAEVGVPFAAIATIRRASEGTVVQARSIWRLDPPVVVTVSWTRGDESTTIDGKIDRTTNLSPVDLSDFPPRTALQSESFTARTELVCQQTGDFSATYVLDVSYTAIGRATFADGPPLFGVPGTIENDRKSYEIVIAEDSGQCIGSSIVATPEPSVTPTPDDLATAAAVLLGTPAPTDTPITEFDERTANSVLLDNGMWVDLFVDLGGGNPAPTLRKSWSGVVTILRYELEVSVTPNTPQDDIKQPVEFKVFADGSRSLIPVAEVSGEFAGAETGHLETRLILDSEGRYVVKGTVGDEPFELTVEAIEPPVNYGVLVQPGTWAGQTPFDLEQNESLINIEGTWEGSLSPPWQAGEFIKRLATQSQIQLRLVGSYVEPMPTSALQTVADVSRIAFDLMLPRAEYEGSLTYHLPASDLNNEPCGGESVVYELHGTLEYLPIGGHWGADVKLTGSLSSPMPKLAAELPASVSITATSSWDQFDVQRMTGQVIDKISVRDSEGSPVGFVIEFSDFQPNPESIIDEESNCEGGVHSIAFVAKRK